MSDNSKVRGPEIKVYKRVDLAELEAHVFYPVNMVGSDKNSCFIFFHPGGWTEGEPLWGYDVCRHFASRGMTAISFEYRLSSPEGYTPADAISDAGSAIAWTMENAAELNIDPDRIVAGGISAGAHVAASAAFIEDPDSKGCSSAVKAVALQSAVVNPVALGQEFVNLLHGADPEKYSPFHHIRPGLPPVCLVHGTADEIVPFYTAEEFTKKMKEAGNRCDLHPFDGTDHFFSNYPDGTEVYKIMDDFFASLGYIEG
ncbi:MAG: alpha/beta hydrolase [Spirochaetes bacterium]|nr:alpha/beta hydrolase [Spirochaetota bacterium]